MKPTELPDFNSDLDPSSDAADHSKPDTSEGFQAGAKAMFDALRNNDFGKFSSALQSVLSLVPEPDDDEQDEPDAGGDDHGHALLIMAKPKAG